MNIRTAFSGLALATLASLSVVACTASTDDTSADATGEVQDQELKTNITSCSVDADCVAVPRGGCCSNGWEEAVNVHHTKAYENATKCTQDPRPMCPMYLVHDTRVAQCDKAVNRCKMFAIEEIACGGFIANAHACPAGFVCSHLGHNPDAGGKCVVDGAAADGNWGASSANLTVQAGHGDIELGCGHATIDALTFSSTSTFTATGTYTAGTGVQPPPGQEPHAQQATFSGQLLGNQLTLTMTVAANTTTMTFKKNVHTQLMHCL